MTFTQVTISLDPEVVEALDRMVADVTFDTSRELAAAAIIRDWLADAGYLEVDEIKEDTPTEGEA